MTSPAMTSEPSNVRRVASPVRWLLAAVGVTCFALGAIGAVLPGLPTTVFLLLGSYFLTRSCPWLEERLLRVPIFRPYLRYLDPSVAMPPRARATALAAMWVSIAFAVALFSRGEGVAVWIPATLVAAGLVGTVAIVRFRRPPAPPGTPALGLD
jgi:hypothetical protein